MVEIPQINRPTRNAISQPFGGNTTGREDFYTRHDLWAHEGVDFGGRVNDPVYNAHPGVVYQIKRQSSGHPYGNHVRVRFEHEGRTFELTYAHLNNINPVLRVGTFIEAGAFLGGMGRSGNTIIWDRSNPDSGVHLHFNYRMLGATAEGFIIKLRDGREVVTKKDVLDPELYFTN